MTKLEVQRISDVINDLDLIIAQADKLKDKTSDLYISNWLLHQSYNISYQRDLLFRTIQQYI